VLYETAHNVFVFLEFRKKICSVDNGGHRNYYLSPKGIVGQYRRNIAVCIIIPHLTWGYAEKSEQHEKCQSTNMNAHHAAMFLKFSNA
jgi:hypothetical protein